MKMMQNICCAHVSERFLHVRVCVLVGDLFFSNYYVHVLGALFTQIWSPFCSV